MRSNDAETKSTRPVPVDPEARAERISVLTECVRTNSYAVDLVELADALTDDAMDQPEESSKR